MEYSYISETGNKVYLSLLEIQIWRDQASKSQIRKPKSPRVHSSLRKWDVIAIGRALDILIKNLS